ncbi:MAG: hypothetical protein J6T11_09145 [Bacteroidaceae bacterium]|nr:hypothetical protein [Bacteroidaceae bacterium]
MKRLLTLALVLVPLLSMAQDDLYFTSSKKAKEDAQKRATAALDAAQRRATASMAARTETVELPTVVDYHSNTRGEDEYNRRYVYGGDFQNAGGAYMDDSLAAHIDTVDNVQPRYDMNDPELDYRYSRRIVRFHSPRLYALTSPYYWDLYYGYGAWDYLYDPWDPWYWHYGWSYGWTWGPWDCWYGGIWGWSHPYSWTYWGWGPGWSRPVYYTSYRRNIVPREFNSSRGHMAAGNRIRTNAGGRNLNTRTTGLGSSVGVVGGRTNVGRSTAQGSRGTNTRTSGASYTDYTNARTGRVSTATNQGARTQVYNAAREGAARRSGIGNTTYQPTRSTSSQNNVGRTTVQQQQTRTQQQPTRTQQQPTRTVQQPTRTTQPQTRTYTPTTTTRSSAGSIGSVGGGGRGGGSFGGGGGGGRSGGGRR